MKPYPKPEKTEKKHLCKKCGKPFNPRTSIQKYCMVRKACISEYLKASGIKKPKNRREANPEVYAKENKADLQRIINKIVRTIDKGVKCIDCHRTEANQWDAGHYRSVGSNPALRFNLHNIFIQHSHCNDFRDVREDFSRGIVETYGQEYFETVEGLKMRYPLIKISAKEYPELKKKANKILRELQKLDKTYCPKERIQLRETINTELGIYL